MVTAYCIQCHQLVDVVKERAFQTGFVFVGAVDYPMCNCNVCESSQASRSSSLDISHIQHGKIPYAVT